MSTNTSSKFVSVSVIAQVHQKDLVYNKIFDFHANHEQLTV